MFATLLFLGASRLDAAPPGYYPDRIEGLAWSAATPSDRVPVVFDWSDDLQQWRADFFGAWRLEIDSTSGAVTGYVDAAAELSGDWSSGVEGRILSGANFAFLPLHSSVDPLASSDRLYAFFLGGTVAGGLLRFFISLYSGFLRVWYPLFRIN